VWTAWLHVLDTWLYAPSSALALLSASTWSSMDARRLICLRTWTGRRHARATTSTVVARESKLARVVESSAQGQVAQQQPGADGVSKGTDRDS
jgi:hypothetical protein